MFRTAPTAPAHRGGRLQDQGTSSEDVHAAQHVVPAGEAMGAWNGMEWHGMVWNGMDHREKLDPCDPKKWQETARWPVFGSVIHPLSNMVCWKETREESCIHDFPSFRGDFLLLGLIARGYRVHKFGLTCFDPFPYHSR